MIKEPIFYVTPDPARAIGLEKILPDYHIVCLEDSPLIDLLLCVGVKVFSLERALGKRNFLLRSTGQLLAHPQVLEYIKRHTGNLRPNILFFKPSKKIELVCQKEGYRMLGNRAYLNEKFEDKISFYPLCQKWGLPIPPGEIKILKEANYQDLARRFGKKMVVQFGHGWAGNTTFFVEKAQQWGTLVEKFGTRLVRITRFIKGQTYLNNACITQDRVFASFPAVQITSPEGFTRSLGGTCGRQWPSNLAPKLEGEIDRYTQIIGKRMAKVGYKGYFGLDFLLEEKTDKIYLSECNARLTASVPLYTKMEILSGQKPLLLYHLEEFLGKQSSLEATGKKAIRGAELLIRNNQDQSVRVTRDFAPGIYNFHQGKLRKRSSDYNLEGIKNKGEFFILAAACERIITMENEIARLDCLEKILDKEGKVESWARQALLMVKEQLALKTHG